MSGKKNSRLLLFLVVFSGTILVSSETQAALKDSDADGLTDRSEIETYHTDPNNPDTDSDGSSDTDEILAGTYPQDVEDFPLQTIPPPERSITSPREGTWMMGIGIIFFFITLSSLFSVIRKKGIAPNAQLPSKE